MNGLLPAELGRASLFQRLLRRKPKENAYREVSNLLANTPIKDLPVDSISSILASYRIDPLAEQERLKTLYSTVLAHFANDAELTDDEVEDLRRLRQILGLADRDVLESSKSVFREAVKGALNDGRVSDDERTRLATLAGKLCLSETIARSLYEVDAATLLKRAYDKALQDRRLSPDEEKELEAIRKNLGVEVEMSSDSQAALAHFRLLWRIDQGDLPQIQAAVLLKRGEICHIQGEATHKEIRTVTRSIRYAGPTARIRIMKGLSYRVGQVSVQRISEDVMKDLDSGTLYLTNKRLLFDGLAKSTTIPLSKVIDFEVFSDGLKIEKESGKDQFFQFTESGMEVHERWASMLRAALLADRA